MRIAAEIAPIKNLFLVVVVVCGKLVLGLLQGDALALGVV